MLYAAKRVFPQSNGSVRVRVCRDFYRSLVVQQLKYKYGSEEQTKLREAIKTMLQSDNSVPCIVRRKKIYSGDEQHLKCPHNHVQLVARYYYCNRQHVEQAIETAILHKADWRNMDCADRANIWRKGAAILAGKKRFELNAAIMLGQSKTCAQAEEDTCHLLNSMNNYADLLQKLDSMKIQRNKDSSVYPTVQIRPLDGFISAIGPYNMISSVNLALCPALMGNVVLWKPADNCVLAAYIIHMAMVEAGLPRGIISFVPTNARLFTNVVTNSAYLAGVNFIGQVQSCREIWQDVAFRLHIYRCLPRLVAECGGNNYHILHETADVDLAVEATLQAAFDYAGQKCNGCSRMYVPQSLWPTVKCSLAHGATALKIGDPCDFNTNCSAVINENVFDRCVEFLLHAQKSTNVEVVCGGDFCKTLGYFIEPTVLLCYDPTDRLMTEQIPGPILAVHVYENNEFDKMLQTVLETAKYAYTGAIFAADDNVICYALHKLRMTAGNLYVNCKCSGAADGNEPFGGNRLSSTYDNYGASSNLLRWTAPQLIEERLPCKGNGGSSSKK